jgi:hypothetical protein
MYEALSYTFPENSTSVGNPVETSMRPVLIYPNPSEGFLTVETSSPFTVSIYNASGRCIYQRFCDSDKAEIDLSLQPPGLYLVRVENETGISTQRFILK